MKLPPAFMPSAASDAPKTSPVVLLRVNLKRGAVLVLKDAADRESRLTGRRVTVSDLVRDAVREWIQARDLTP